MDSCLQYVRAAAGSRTLALCGTLGARFNQHQQCNRITAIFFPSFDHGWNSSVLGTATEPGTTIWRLFLPNVRVASILLQQQTKLARFNICSICECFQAGARIGCWTDGRLLLVPDMCTSHCVLCAVVHPRRDSMIQLVGPAL